MFSRLGHTCVRLWGQWQLFKRDVLFKFFHVEDRRVFLRHVDKSDSQTVRHAFASEKGVNRNVLQRVVSDVFDCSLM